MNEIDKQVSRARRRIITGKFFSILTWAAFVSLIVALVGIAIPKVWHLDFLDSQRANDAWLYSWLLGSIVIGFIVTAVLTWRSRGSRVDTAVEVDRRFGLKARLSSALNLSSDDINSEAGQALLSDAERRAEDLDIRDKFGYQPTWHALTPLAPLLLMLGVLFLPNAEMASVADEENVIDKKKVVLEVKELKKKFEEKRAELEAKGLKDASENLKSLGKKFDKLLSEKTDLDKKETLVQLNNIKKEIEEKRKALGDSKEFKENLNKLKNVGKGPAKKLAKAIGEGNFKKAKDAIKDLAKKLKDGELDKEDMAKLADDLKKLGEAIKKANQQREREIEELKKKIEKAKQEGDLQKAAELQEKLEKKEQQQEQMKKMNNLAKKMEKCANCMKPGDGKNGKKGQPQDGKPNGQKGEPGQKGQQGEPGQSQKDAMKEMQRAMKEAGESLEDLAQEMEELEKQMEEMEALEDLEQMAEDCKDGCQGNGGQPNNNDQRKRGWGDWAKGAGIGEGLRDKEEEDTGNFKARVKGDVGRGKTIRVGSADGKNITGRSASETRELVRASMDRDVDPLENQKLTKKQLEHAKQYFKALREN